MRLHRSLLSILAASALLASCKRDIALPPLETSPRVVGIQPASAYAGERVVIAGSGFDATPEGNLVQFARASARAEAVDAAGLIVRVPPDAGTGAFTVTTRRGVSAPSAAPFTYRGLGQLRTNVVSAEIPLLHKPYRVSAVAGDTFIHSDLLLGILRYGDPLFVAANGVTMDSAAWWSVPSMVWLELDGTVSTLVRQPVPSGARVARALGTTAGTGPIVAMGAGGGTVAVVRKGASDSTIMLHDLSSLDPLPGWGAGPVETPQPLGVADLRGCVDAGNSELACLVRHFPDDPLTLARVRFSPSPSLTFLAAPATPLVEDPIQLDDPLCADTVTRQAVVALQDGTIAAADLTPLSPAFAAPVETGSRTPARSLACAGAGRVLVAKRGDDVVTSVTTAGTLQWSAAVPKASRMAVDCSTSPCEVHVAGEADNHVLLLRSDTGALLARRSFDVLPGRVDDPNALLERTADQGAAWYHAAGSVPNLAFVTAAPRGVVRLPLTAQRGTGLFPDYTPSDAVAVAPGVTSAYALVLDDEALDGSALLGAGQLALDAPFPYAHAATSAGLETLDYTAYPAVTRTVSAIPGAAFTSLGSLPDGRVYGSLWDGTSWSVRGWTVSQAAAGLAAGAVWDAPDAVAGAAVLDGTLWAFWWEVASESQLDLHAVELTSSFTSGTTFVQPDVFYAILAVSPNGRTFVSWDYQPFSRDTSVIIWSADAAAGFARLATIPVEGQVTGVAFDGTGEALYVLTRGPDRVIVLE